MNDEKYNRLTSTERLSEEQLAGFIARQLVETAQGAKGIAELMKRDAAGNGYCICEAQEMYLTSEKNTRC